MGKNQFPSTFWWNSVNPTTTFLPCPGPNCTVAGNSPQLGAIQGTMSGTNTIYTNILGLRQSDNQGIEITFTGTPTGTLSVMVSNSGINWYALTYNPAIVQPAGAPGGFVIANIGIPFQYCYLQYTNVSGTGVITAYNQCKANNQ